MGGVRTPPSEDLDPYPDTDAPSLPSLSFGMSLFEGDLDVGEHIRSETEASCGN